MENGSQRDLLKKIAISTVGYGMYADSVVIPLVSAIMTDYPEASEGLIKFVITGNSIAAMIAIVATTFLLKRIRKKPMLIIGTVMFALGGIGSAFCPNLEWLAVMRALDSASDGVLTVTATAMIVELWREEKEQGRVFGLYNGVSGLFGCLATIVAGYAAVVSWRAAFLVNAISLISLVLCIFFVPEPEKITNGKLVEEPPAQWEIGLQWHPWKFFGAMLVMNLLQTVSYTATFLMDILISDKGIGNSVVTGYMSLIPLFIGTGGNLVVAGLLMKFRRKDLFAAVFTVMLSMSMFLFALGNSIQTMVLANILSVVSGVCYVMYFNMYTVRTVPRKQRVMCIGIMTQSIYLDTIACAYVPNVTEWLFHTETIAQCCFWCGIMLLFVSGAYVITAFFSRKKDYAYS